MLNLFKHLGFESNSSTSASSLEGDTMPTSQAFGQMSHQEVQPEIDSQSLPDSLRDMLNLWADKDIQNAILYVYDNFLSKPYEEEPEAHYATRIIQGQVIHRPWHGLAHTLRGAFLIPIVAILCKTSENEALSMMGSQLADPLVTKQLIITYLFSVTGRQSEAGFTNGQAYERYLRTSAEKFEIYASQSLMHVFKYHQTRTAYKNSICNYGDPDNAIPRCILFRHCHNLDLLRCRSSVEFEEYILPGNKEQDHTLIKDFGSEIAYALKAYSRSLLAATGSCITGYDVTYTPHNDDRFLLANTSAQTCIDMLLEAQIPEVILQKVLSCPANRLKK